MSPSVSFWAYQSHCFKQAFPYSGPAAIRQPAPPCGAVTQFATCSPK